MDTILLFLGIIAMLAVGAWIFDSGLATDESPLLYILAILFFGYILSSC